MALPWKGSRRESVSGVRIPHHPPFLESDMNGAACGKNQTENPMREIIVREHLWYLALQDGPAENGVFYETREKAEEELKRWGDAGKGTCVMYTNREYPLADMLAPRKGG